LVCKIKLPVVSAVHPSPDCVVVPADSMLMVIL